MGATVPIDWPGMIAQESSAQVALPLTEIGLAVFFAIARVGDLPTIGS